MFYLYLKNVLLSWESFVAEYMVGWAIHKATVIGNGYIGQGAGASYGLMEHEKSPLFRKMEKFQIFFYLREKMTRVGYSWLWKKHTPTFRSFGRDFCG